MKNAILIGLAMLSLVAISVLATLAAVRTESAPPLSVEDSTPALVTSDDGLPIAPPSLGQGERADAGHDELETALESISVAELLPSELPTEEEIAAKYTAFEGPDFVGLAKARGMYYTQLADIIAKRKLKSGQCATKIIEATETFGPILGKESWPGDLPPVDGLSVEEISDGLLEIKHAQVFPDEDPKLHALYVEVEWLRKQAAPYQ